VGGRSRNYRDGAELRGQLRQPSDLALRHLARRNVVVRGTLDSCANDHRARRRSCCEIVEEI